MGALEQVRFTQLIHATGIDWHCAMVEDER